MNGKCIRALVIISIVLALFLTCTSAPELPVPVIKEQPLETPARESLFLLDSGPITLDPAVSVESGSHSYILNIFSGLVTFDKDLNIIPDIARGWDITNSGLTYTFYLQTNVKFHDGRPVKAGDFKYSLERAASPKTKSKTAQTYLGDIIGVGDMLQGKAKDISGIKVIDDYTLQITIDRPKVYFLAKLTYPTAFVVDRKNVESGNEWWLKPNGTGVFKLRQWVKDQRIVLERNDNFYRQPARTRYIVYQLYAGDAMQMYEKGEIDITSVPFIYLERVTDLKSPLNKQLTVYPESSITYLGFNVTKPPFDDAGVRKAFMMSVNRDKIVSQILRGYVAPAYGLLPEGFPGYNHNLTLIPYDPVQARKLIETSLYGSTLPPIIITMAGIGGTISPIYQAIITDWQKYLGASISVRELEPEIYNYELKEEKDNIYEFGWVADYPDPQNFLDVLFHTGSEHNTGEYSNRQLDSLLDQAGSETDAGSRIRMYRDAEQMVMDDAAFIPLWFGRSYLLIRPYVKGYYQTPMGYPMLGEVTVERP